MTHQDKNDETKTTDRKPPQIVSEEDKPFPESSKGTSRMDQHLDQTRNIRERITIFKYLTGKRVLYISMIAMAFFAGVNLVTSHFWGVEDTLLNSAFEAFKLITMTVLGFIFGANDTRSD